MKLSIVVTAYNMEHHIARTLNSLICQTTKKFELILVDDGSVDRTYSIAKEYLQGLKGASHKIITKENGGVSSARNSGLKAASGEYIMFLDGDDYVADHLVERIYDTLQRQSSDVICWGYDLVNEDKEVLANYFDTYHPVKTVMTGPEALNHVLVKRTMWIWTGSAAFRKDFLLENQLIYTEGCFNGEDQEFTIKVLSKTDSVVFINEILSFYVQREGSITNSHSVRKFDAIGALKRAACYYNTTNEKELRKIADMIDRQYLVENYFNNLDSCMTSAKIRPLLNEIDENYPGLNQEIKNAMLQYGKNRDLNNRFQLKCKLFLISPDFYAACVFLKRRVLSLWKVR